MHHIKLTEVTIADLRLMLSAECFKNELLITYASSAVIVKPHERASTMMGSFETMSRLETVFCLALS